jgi:thymidine phosphorylase
MVHAATEAQADAAIAAVQAAYAMGEVAPDDPALILKRVA